MLSHWWEHVGLTRLCTCVVHPPARFCYTDTYKVLQYWGPGCLFYGRGLASDLHALTEHLAAGRRTGTDGEKGVAESPILALMCEFPSNPLLRSADLNRLRSLADEYGFIVVIDDTVGNFINVDVFDYADVLVTSLTKIFSGKANVMGGR
jgi:cystathionine gamma-synthase